MFEYACDHGNPEAFIPLFSLRTYLNRLEAMRIKSGVEFYKLPEDQLRVEGIYDFEEDDMPPDYTSEDEDLPPAYGDLYGLQQRKLRKQRVQVLSKRKRALTIEAEMPMTKVVVLRYASGRRSIM